MRVTNSMLVNNFMRNLNVNLTRVDKLQTQLAKNKKFAHISDDPVSVIYAQQARYKLWRIDDYTRNVERTGEWLTAAETAVLELNEILKSASESCVSAATDAKTDEDRRLMSEYIGQLRDHVLGALNAAFGDKFLFGGYNTTGHPDTGKTVPPFQADAQGRLTLNGVDLTARAFTGTAAGSIAGAAVTVNDDALLQKTLAGARTITVTFSDGGGGALNVTAAGETVSVSSAAGLSAVSFAGSGFTLDLSGLAPALPGLGTDISGQITAVGTGSALFDSDAAPAVKALHDRLRADALTFDVGPGIDMEASLNGIGLALYNANGDNIYNLLSDLHNALATGAPAEEISKVITPLQAAQAHMLASAAELGGRQNRLEMLASRYADDEINYRQMLSNAEDAEQAELIMEQKMAEAVYKAALQTGAFIIQPTLMDFLR